MKRPNTLKISDSLVLEKFFQVYMFELKDELKDESKNVFSIKEHYLNPNKVRRCEIFEMRESTKSVDERRIVSFTYEGRKLNCILVIFDGETEKQMTGIFARLLTNSQADLIATIQKEMKAREVTSIIKGKTK